MKKLIQKIRDYFNHRRNYKTLKTLVFKNAKNCDFEECFELMTLLATFKKERCMYRVVYDDNIKKGLLNRVYPEVAASSQKETGVTFKKEVL